MIVVEAAASASTVAAAAPVVGTVVLLGGILGGMIAGIPLTTDELPNYPPPITGQGEGQIIESFPLPGSTTLTIEGVPLIQEDPASIHGIQAPNQAGELLITTASINWNKQRDHVYGEGAYNNRVKQGTPTSYFPDKTTAEALVQEAWAKGTPTTFRGTAAKVYDFGRPVGVGGFGGTQSQVTVIINSKGEIHGFPSGKETP